MYVWQTLDFGEGSKCWQGQLRFSEPYSSPEFRPQAALLEALEVVLLCWTYRVAPALEQSHFLLATQDTSLLFIQLRNRQKEIHPDMKHAREFLH